MDKLIDEIDCNANNYSETVLNGLRALTELLKCETNRLALTHNFWSVMTNLVAKSCSHLSLNNHLLENHIVIDIIIEIYRSLRNLCVNCGENQRLIVDNDQLFNDSFKLFRICLKFCTINQNFNANTVIKCQLQYFGNLLAVAHSNDDHNNDVIKTKVWTLFGLDLFRELLTFSCDDNSIALIASMILYNCSANDNLVELISSRDQLLPIIGALLSQIANELSEWSLWTVELLLSNENFILNIYDPLSDKFKLVLLDIIHEFLNNNVSEGQKCNELSETNLNYLRDLFKLSVSDIVMVDSNSDKSEYSALQISKLLAIMCKLTSSHHYLSRLQTDPEIIKLLIDTLKTIHLLGKTDTSLFKPLRVLKSVEENDVEAENPVFGFKRDIIRLIANLVYRCPPLQDMVRENDGIPLILDCCNIDAANPYILQWSIFAMKNVLNDNALNQQIVSNLSRNGVLMNDKIMNELGIKISH